MRETEAPSSAGTWTLQSGERPRRTTKARTLKRWLLCDERSTTCTSKSGDGVFGSVGSSILRANRGSNLRAGALLSSAPSCFTTVRAVLETAEGALEPADVVAG